MKDEKKEEFKLHLVELYSYLHRELKLKTVPKVVLDSDQKNSDKILGKTGYYDPKKKEIHLFIVDRHPKDILRSFSHEVIHHWQHEHEQLEKHTNEQGESDPQYAQHNPWLRQMEKQAYLLGNIMFRDWEDEKKNSGRKSGKKMVQEGQSEMGELEWKEEEAFEEGANARHEGVKRTANPYIRSNYSHSVKKALGRSWDDGWNMIDMDSDTNGAPPINEELMHTKQLYPNLYMVFSSEDHIHWVPLIDHKTEGIDSLSDMIKNETRAEFIITKSGLIVFHDKDEAKKVSNWLAETYSGVYSFKVDRVQ